jgi:hypothetical protein
MVRPFSQGYGGDRVLKRQHIARGRRTHALASVKVASRRVRFRIYNFSRQRRAETLTGRVKALMMGFALMPHASRQLRLRRASFLPSKVEPISLPFRVNQLSCSWAATLV